jgi:hypothetical protein
MPRRRSPSTRETTSAARRFATSQAVSNFKRTGFNNEASSVVVEHGRWEVCEDSQFRGRCVVLRRGSYDSLANLGPGEPDLVGPAGLGQPPLREPAAAGARHAYEYVAGPNERLSEAPVTSVRAVMGRPSSAAGPSARRQRAREARLQRAGRVIGGVLGGILGHQIGSGTGKDIATVGGVVGGAAIGAT